MSELSTIQKPTLRTVQTSFGSSFSFKRFTDEEPDGFSKWHHHPELELVYIEHGSGKRHIGNHLSYYSDGDLLLIGPYLPHYGFAHRLTQKNTEVVIQFREDFLGDSFLHAEEMKKIKELIDRSSHGLSFYGSTKTEIGVLLDEMVVMNQFERLMHLLRVLQKMAQSTEYMLLNAGNFIIEVDQTDNDRMKKIYEYVREHFQREIALQEMADMTNMTIPSFCRYFKKQTGKTFTQFVNEFRVIHACKLLSETNRTISDICFECGFNNFSHFNKQFKQVVQKNPSAYRSEFKEVIS